MTIKTPVLDLENVSFSYDRKPVLEDINFGIEPGEFVGLVGPNGSGKTTLIKIILGLLKANHGEVRLFGQPLSKFKKLSWIGYVSQKSNSFNSGFPATVFEVVSMGLYSQMKFYKWFGKKERLKVWEALEKVGMEDYAKQNIGRLSGGQQQRVFIARALVRNPKLLILDEPTVGVDAKSENAFYDLIESMHKEKLAILLVSHDIGTITSKVDKVLCLNKRLHYHGDPKQFEMNRQEILTDAYGQHFELLEHHH
ncbi:zinc transport system ATP-binding protein [Scopulibacillus daqui]|uniref:Zinc transport system ATP-binding protein n=1 Tax=Scopulibacillus daqui TaxID=1469162 RepID=A0ABS2PVP0_9BACL|nr:metal ABC transporter ATP-binding protein [Scopulibacillus daqui]MBM7644129.1 zinc transport system ATP-binding protein [Scopulibacillus daqui]